MSFDDPRCAVAILRGGDDAGANLTKDRRGAQIEHRGGFGQRDFAALGSFAIPIDRDVMRVAEAPHTPTVSIHSIIRSTSPLS